MSKEKRIENFSRFYAALHRLPYTTDEDTKESLVQLYTGHRTSSLREMTYEEYDEMCRRLEDLTDYRGRLKKWRSHVLHQMQRMGIDTSDWPRINAFCSDPRIAGKVFARLSEEDLKRLSMKLRTIQRKGGLKAKKEPTRAVQPQVECMVLPIGNGGEA